MRLMEKSLHIGLRAYGNKPIGFSKGSVGYVINLLHSTERTKRYTWSQEPMTDFFSLLKAARNLDANALTAIFDLYSPAIYKFASRLVHDPIVSDAIVADVFGRLMEELAAGKGPRTNIRLYLYRSAYQLVLERLRDAHPHSSLEVAIVAPKRDEPAPMQSQTDERAMVEALLTTMNTELSEDQRLVIILRFLEDFSLKETAEIIGKDVNNVKVIQNRGFARLKKAMGMEAEAEDD
jgi:RNA polymerase sigma-70 factor (ECF subfamily)